MEIGYDKKEHLAQERRVMMKTIEYKIVDCGFNAPEWECEHAFEKTINELAEDRWEPLFPISKYRIIMARTITPSDTPISDIPASP